MDFFCFAYFSKHGVVGWMVGLDVLRGLFQPMILWIYDSTLRQLKQSLLFFFTSHEKEETGNQVKPTKRFLSLKTTQMQSTHTKN